MTYCLAIKTNDGIVLASDSRTNAGVDNVNIYSKMHAFVTPGQRAFVLLTAGNLATSLAVVNALQHDLDDPKAKCSLNTVDYLYEATDYVGELSCRIQARHCEDGKHKDIDLGASFILGGQIAGRPHEIFQVYPEGNYISPSATNPYFQIGETKYGKPILDRIIDLDTSLEDAARCALVSIDSTMRSNVSVGPPIELTVYRKDSYVIERHVSLDTNDAYYEALRAAWSDGLVQVFQGLPHFDWE